MPDRPSSSPATASQKPKIRPFASLQHREYRIFWMGHPFTVIGLMMRNTTNAYQVYHLTDSKALLGLTFLFQGLPFIIMGLFGGTLADILPKRLVLRGALIGEIALAIVLAILSFSGSIEVWHIFAITFTASCFAAVEQPARSSMLAKLVPRELLLNATTLNAVTAQMSLLLGPLMGGVLIDTAGPGWSYVFNAFFLVPALISLGFLRFPDLGQRGKVRFNVNTILEGLRFAIGTRVLALFILMDTVTMLVGFYPALLPVYAKDILHVSGTGLGSLYAAASFGAVAGFLGILFLGNVQRMGLVIVTVIALHGVALIGFAVTPWFGLSLFFLVLLGLLDAISVSVRQTSFQLLAKDENRGRVVSLVSMTAVSSNSLGGAYLGLAAALMGPQTALAIGGAIGLTFTLFVAMAYPPVRRFRA